MPQPIIFNAADFFSGENIWGRQMATHSNQIL